MARCMRTTRRAEKVWEPSDQTQKPTPSAHSIISNAIHYRGLSKAGQSGMYAVTKPPSHRPTDGSIWGWAAMHQWTSENGYFSAGCDDVAPELPFDPEDE